MGYRLEWRLLGHDSRLLDTGDIEGDLVDHQSAMGALNGLLLTFPLWGRNKAGGYWWAWRSPDADMELQVSLQDA